MDFVDLDEVPVEEHQSPGGRYHLLRRNISLALGGIKDVGEWGGGHPFDVEEVTLMPGARNYPTHYHTAQWEMYIILSGAAVLRHAQGDSPVGPGTSFMCQPGEPHMLRNTGEEPLSYLVIASNPPSDLCHYPESGKWHAKPPGRTFEMRETDYFEEGD